MLKHYIVRFWSRNLTTYQVLFLYHLDQKHFPPQTVPGQWHSSLDPQFVWISPWLGWKAIYVEKLNSALWARNLTMYQVIFLLRHQYQKCFNSQALRGQWHSSLDPQFIWRNLWLVWKAIYVETLYSAFLSAKFDNVSSTFFCIPPKFLPPQTVLGQWQYSLDPQFIWISPWLGWKAIYVETLYTAFLGAKFDNVSSTFYYANYINKLFALRLYSGRDTPP